MSMGQLFCSVVTNKQTPGDQRCTDKRMPVLVCQSVVTMDFHTVDNNSYDCCVGDYVMHITVVVVVEAIVVFTSIEHHPNITQIIFCSLNDQTKWSGHSGYRHDNRLDVSISRAGHK